MQSDILTNLTDMLVCDYFMDARRHESLRPETKDFIAHSKSSSQSSILACVNFSSSLKSHGDNTGPTGCIAREKIWAWRIHHF